MACIYVPLLHINLDVLYIYIILYIMPLFKKTVSVDEEQRCLQLEAKMACEEYLRLKREKEEEQEKRRRERTERNETHWAFRTGTHVTDVSQV